MLDHALTPLPADRKARIIVVGNEKGGAGKTTISTHLIISLLALGFEVGSIDVDSRQLSLSRYLDNRRKTIINKGINLYYPNHAIVRLSPFNVIAEAEQDEARRFYAALSKACMRDDFVVIDTPGSNSNLSRLAHSYADMVITPINDSFVDLDVIVQVERGSLNIEKPGIYSEMVWEQKIRKAKRDRGGIDWIIVRNRLASIDAKNKRNIEKVLAKLSSRIGLRVATGFGERVIYREMFLHGLTLLDLNEKGTGVPLSMSHISAKQELREFLKELNIPEVNERLSQPVEKEMPKATPEKILSEEENALSEETVARQEEQPEEVLEPTTDVPVEDSVVGEHNAEPVWYRETTVIDAIASGEVDVEPEITVAYGDKKAEETLLLQEEDMLV